MHAGHIVLGGSTAAALAAAVLAGIAIAPSTPLSAPAGNGGGYCAGWDESRDVRGPISLAFVLRNDADSPTTLRAVAPRTAVNVKSFRFTIVRATEDTDVTDPGVVVGGHRQIADGQTEADPAGFTLAAHQPVVVIATLTLADGADSGSLNRIGATFDGPLGTLRTEIFALSLGQYTTSSAGCPVD